MIAYCDALDGPVVAAARKALESGNVNYVLPWVSKEFEDEIKAVFMKVLKIRDLGEEILEVSDLCFFETLVRLHRMSFGLGCFCGLKPEGHDWGPIVRMAVEAFVREDPAEVVDFIEKALREELELRFKRALDRQNFVLDDVDAAREYVREMWGFVLFANELYCKIVAGNDRQSRRELDNLED